MSTKKNNKFKIMYEKLGKALTQELCLNPNGLEGSVLTGLEDLIFEIRDDGSFGKITSPISGQVYLITGDLNGVLSQAGMMYLSKWFMERGGRTFMMPDTLVVNTSMPECEMRKTFDDLLSKMPSDDEFLRALAIFVKKAT